MKQLEEIRLNEKAYHDYCYSQNKLFEEGSWLGKPAKSVVDVMEFFNGENHLRILDLGSGVGRNSIPIAQKYGHQIEKIIGVDLIESAKYFADQYAKLYEVGDKIVTVVSDISKFDIVIDDFDYIFAVSSLEHIESIEVFEEVLQHIIEGTTTNGINAFIINSNITEYSLTSNRFLEPSFEIRFETQQLLDMLKVKYASWNVIRHDIKPYEVKINRDKEEVLLRGDAVTWIVNKTH
ncbi:class I SAM-dependent methyltransferase [Paenibacillus endoradicis]|uniref:class I SAM-dependent methyltransferase n=1 Tax=Paenibacillus endoradicis TaxID=2972487 RepID=UPI00215923FB|nr:class I SAM-dependent methyltransferase [Paenibacillus endoradicis]MCR8656234.1 class I SAM-dependent methyltransferase [Paenibacillus endoradicis]